MLRPRWTGLYAARKKQKDEAISLPQLPDTFFGWIPVLWRITDEQVLASAGLDAYVFLAFFKMAIKYLVVTLFFALVVIKPVHDANPEKTKGDHGEHNETHSSIYGVLHRPVAVSTIASNSTDGGRWLPKDYDMDYLWMYVVFAYVFSAYALYLVVSETRKIIDLRQEYLGTQTTITDRTIRLSGIPSEYRDEEKIKDFIELLEIGQVESVTLCRNWKELDKAMIERMSMLRRLEEAWTVHLGQRRVERNLESLPITQPEPPGPVADIAAEEEETDNLLGSEAAAHISPYARERPTTRVWYGPLKLRYRKVDAIDYYEEKLRRMDENIAALRQKEFEPTPLAFVTMDSVASAQMATQAVLDPSPLQFLANTSPAPSDVVWPNTYLPRSRRMLYAWIITLIIAALTVFWAALLVPIAGALNLATIRKVSKPLADFLDDHDNIKSLVQTQLPTVIASLLNVAVPFLYDWLSNQQGMISQGDVELSVISKNFFYVFFNFFLVFTGFGTASNFYDILKNVGGNLDTSQVARSLASSLQKLAIFYANYIILQGVGLMPFRLLEFGSVALYPIYLMGAKTPRDYAELVQPPVFLYGYYLPQTILIFILCIVYSVLRFSWLILLAGLAYFMLGHFVHKYQLLYAMDHRQHATGRGWMMMCERVILGVVIFQLTMAGQVALKGNYERSLVIFPLVFATLWFSYTYNRTYRPLLDFIALRSLRKAEHQELRTGMEHPSGMNPVTVRNIAASSHRRTLDETREAGLRFVNPSLVIPLEGVWIAGKKLQTQNGDLANSGTPSAMDGTTSNSDVERNPWRDGSSQASGEGD